MAQGSTLSPRSPRHLGSAAPRSTDMSRAADQLAWVRQLSYAGKRARSQGLLNRQRHAECCEKSSESLDVMNAEHTEGQPRHTESRSLVELFPPERMIRPRITHQRLWPAYFPL
jgi:hypothetical protein